MQIKLLFFNLFVACLQSPQPKKPWDGTLKAFSDSPLCIQRDPFRRDLEIDGSEDCLYVNVYAPEVVKEPLPVMVKFFRVVFVIFSKKLINSKRSSFTVAAICVEVASNHSMVPITCLNTMSFISVQTSD